MAKKQKFDSSPNTEERKLIEMGYEQMDLEMNELFITKSQLITSYLLNEVVARGVSFEDAAHDFGKLCLKQYQAKKLHSAGEAVKAYLDEHTVGEE